MAEPESSVWVDLMSAHQTARDPHRSEVPTHSPRAAVLCCSDARVAPNVIFGASVGELFVVRVAGNTLCPEARASLNYAVGALGVELIIVLGHTECGAVAAACAGVDDPDLAAIVAPIGDRLARGETSTVNDLVELNVAAVVAQIRSSDSAVGRAGATAVVGAVYDLAHDRVVEVEG